MKTTTDKLNCLINTKESIRQEINRAYENEEIGTSDTFRSYIQKLEEQPFYTEELIEGNMEHIESSNITNIGKYIFGKSRNLISMSFPETISISESAFRECLSLTTIGATFFPKVKTIDYQAFYGCTNLTSISFPKVTTIGSGAFSHCSGLNNVSFPEATYISNHAFASSGPIDVTETSFPKVTTIDEYAFVDNHDINNVYFPKVENIKDYAFSSCWGLSSVNFPNATIIGYGAFNECKCLTSVSFPNVTTIGGHAFYGRNSLTSASFPKVTTIGAEAFRNSTNLKDIYIGTNTSTVCALENINAFFGCSSLTNIYVPATLVDSYKSDPIWSSKSTILKKIKAAP